MGVIVAFTSEDDREGLGTALSSNLISETGDFQGGLSAPTLKELFHDTLIGHQRSFWGNYLF